MTALRWLTTALLTALLVWAALSALGRAYERMDGGRP